MIAGEVRRRRSLRSAGATRRRSAAPVSGGRDGLHLCKRDAKRGAV